MLLTMLSKTIGHCYVANGTMCFEEVSLDLCLPFSIMILIIPAFDKIYTELFWGFGVLGSNK